MSKYMPERMPDRISSIMYFQMVCQKLCQNSMSWWGSLEASLLAPSAWPLRKWLKLFSFGTWTCLVGGLEHFLFPIIYGNNNPNWLIFFRGVGLPPTSCFFSAKSHNSRTSPVDEAVVFCSLIVMLVIPPASSAIPRPWRQMPNLKAASQQVIHPDTFWHSQCQSTLTLTVMLVSCWWCSYSLPLNLLVSNMFTPNKVKILSFDWFMSLYVPMLDHNLLGETIQSHSLTYLAGFVRP